MSELIVRIEHGRQLKYCVSGIRNFFAQHNLDFRDFLQNGIEAEYFLQATCHDEMVVAMVEVARNGR